MPPIRLTPGADLVTYKMNHTCRCGVVVILGQVRDEVGTLKWRNFESTPVEREAHRYYRRHFCTKEST